MKREYVLAWVRPERVSFYSRKARNGEYVWDALARAKKFKSKVAAERFFFPIWGYGANAMTVVQARNAIESYR